MISRAMEDYLKTIYKLQEIGEPVTNSTISKRLGIAPASVTSMIKRLDRLDLVKHEPYRGETFTVQGKNYAVKVVRHHRLSELFLSTLLGIPWDRVHEEAHRLEHAVSGYLAENIAKALDNPVRDPHGHLIPDKNGDILKEKIGRLSTIDTTQAVIISSVDDENPELLRYLGKLGLYPGTGVEVLEREPFGGSLKLRVDKRECNLGIEAAEHVWVAVNDTLLQED
jgi:DtxR family Mn-dependent transcriptional regulator